MPGLPGGAPHAAPPRRPRVYTPPAPPPAEVLHDEPYDAPAPMAMAKKTPTDEAIVPLVLAGLGIVTGIFV